MMAPILRERNNSDAPQLPFRAHSRTKSPASPGNASAQAEQAIPELRFAVFAIPFAGWLVPLLERTIVLTSHSGSGGQQRSAFSTSKAASIAALSFPCAAYFQQGS